MVVECIVNNAQFRALLHKRIAQKKGEPACIFDPKSSYMRTDVEKIRRGVSLEVVEVEATRHDVTDH